MDSTESLFVPAGGTVVSAPIKGGKYALAASFVSSGGTIIPQVQGPDGASWVSCGTWVSPGAVSSGYGTFDMPAGMARVSVVGGGTTVQAALTRYSI